jgi:hypothetical protein
VPVRSSSAELPPEHLAEVEGRFRDERAVAHDTGRNYAERPAEASRMLPYVPWLAGTIPVVSRFAAVVVAVALFASGADASSSRGAIRCRAHPTPIDRSAPLGHATPLGNVLWLGVYPFQPGYPTKTIVMAQRSLKRPIVLRGWSCADGSPLRFWYREGLPFGGHVPVTDAELRRTGNLRAAFGPWPKRAMTGGYLMFWRTGLWKIVAYERQRVVGTAVVEAKLL